MSRGDVIALQHDAGPASLLCCQPSQHSPWRQPVLALNQSEWFWFRQSDTLADPGAEPPPDPELDLKALVTDGEGDWMEDVVCPLRVLYMGQSEIQLQGEQLSAGLPQPGLYSMVV